MAGGDQGISQGRAIVKKPITKKRNGRGKKDLGKDELLGWGRPL